MENKLHHIFSAIDSFISLKDSNKELGSILSEGQLNLMGLTLLNEVNALLNEDNEFSKDIKHFQKKLKKSLF